MTQDRWAYILVESRTRGNPPGLWYDETILNVTASITDVSDAIVRLKKEAVHHGSGPRDYRAVFIHHRVIDLGEVR